MMWLDSSRAQRSSSVNNISTSVWCEMLNCWCEGKTLQWMPCCGNKLSQIIKCENRWQYQQQLLHIILQLYLSLYIPEKDLKIAVIETNFIICFATSAFSFSTSEHCINTLPGPKFQRKNSKCTISWFFQKCHISWHLFNQWCNAEQRGRYTKVGQLLEAH